MRYLDWRSDTTGQVVLVMLIARGENSFETHPFNKIRCGVTSLEPSHREVQEKFRRGSASDHWRASTNV
jgi:hypothetical protein